MRTINNQLSSTKEMKVEEKDNCTLEQRNDLIEIPILRFFLSEKNVLILI